MSILTTVAVYALILLLTRIAGLRSFSKMSAADFAMTVAVGSLFASSISSPSPSLTIAAVSFSCLFASQWLVAQLRQRWSAVGKVVDNQPVLLMAGANVLEENLRRTNVTQNDLYAKLREANVRNFDEVKAVVFETTGDISVIHASEDVAFDTRILRGVKDREQLASSLAKNEEASIHG